MNTRSIDSTDGVGTTLKRAIDAVLDTGDWLACLVPSIGRRRYHHEWAERLKRCQNCRGRVRWLDRHVRLDTLAHLLGLAR